MGTYKVGQQDQALFVSAFLWDEVSDFKTSHRSSQKTIKRNGNVTSKVAR